MRRPDRPARLCLAVALVPALVGLSAPALAQEDLEPSAQLVLEDLRPRVLSADSPFQALGRLVNDGPAALEDVDVQLRVGDRLSSRSQLERADGTDLTYRRLAATTDLADVLAPGQEVPVDLRSTVADLPLFGDGVYPVQLLVRADGAPVTDVRTYLPWFAENSEVDPLRLSWVVPLADVPRTAADGTLLDDDLGASLADGGRLGRTLAGARAGEQGVCDPLPAPAEPPVAPAPPDARTCSQVPVTYAVDPDLLATADAMTRDYAVADRGGRTRPGGAQEDAGRWLESLGEAGRQGDVLALPFADPDVVALTRPGADLGAQVDDARDLGERVTADVLGVEPLDSVLLPPPGPVGDAALDALATPRSQAVVLDPTALAPEDDRRTSTPGTRADLPSTGASGPLTGLVLDAGLSALLERPGDQGPRVAAQRFLVETAMIAAELPSRGRTLLVVPPRRGELDPTVLGQALRDTGRTPWTCPVTLAAVAAATERCPGAATPSYDAQRDGTLAPAGPAEELVPAEQPLDDEAVSRSAAARDRVAQFTDAVLVGGTEQAQAVRTSYSRALLRTVSSAWREDPALGSRLTGLLEDGVSGLFGSVTLSTQPVTLTSRSSRLDYTITNTLDQPVTVQVRLLHPRLRPGPQEVLEVGANSTAPFSVEATTVASGRFSVQATLLDREGSPIAPAQDFDVRSTRYGSVALGLTGVATAVLLVAAGLRITRRALGR